MIIMLRNQAAGLILGLLIGICGTMALHVDRPGPDAGDWLGFAGALVGVVLTIVGALWLEGHKASAGARDDSALLLKVLGEITVALDRTQSARGDDAIALARPLRIADEEALLKSFDKFGHARQYAPKRNIAAWYAIEELNESICRERPMLEGEISTITNHGDNENVFEVNIAKMGEMSERLARGLAEARQALVNSSSP